jgi:hypothetical protein
MDRKVLGAQGEITFYSVSEMPSGLVPIGNNQLDKNGLPIISHSENGNHHILDRAVCVMERMDAPEGMRILYALLDAPTQLLQDAPDAHGSHMLMPGVIEFRISREVDHFTQQIRQVAD